MELTTHQTEIQAEIIKSLVPSLILLDIEYVRELAKELKEKASWQESAFILNPNPSFSKLDLLREQAKALTQLCDYVDTLKAIDGLKGEVEQERIQRDTISKLFM